VDFFPKATQWLADKAGAASIDWTALAAKGQDSVFSTEYMDQYMLPAFNRCAQVMDTLDLKHGTTAEAMANYFKIRDSLSDTADTMLQVVGTATTTTIQLVANPTGAPIQLMAESFQNILWYMWAMALTGANMHITAQIQKSGVPDADIAYHASLVTMMFNVITRLDDFGMLKPFKKSGTSGLGAVPLIAIIVLGAVAIIALAWAVVAIFEISQRNEVVKAACVQATNSGDPQAIINCQKLFSTPEGDIAGQLPKSISDVVQKIAIFAMVGAGIYLAVQFGPGIATKLKQSATAWKTS
jgi:hypothetical protein